METIRNMERVITGHPTSDGAGVKLTRIIGNNDTGLFDPFLLLDFFGSDNPDDFMAGFPWHPHRGIETVTYMLEGKVEHGDSMGNSGVIGSGDVQWMTAGSGIIHQEMPQNENGRNHGFQLWVNLPASHKMVAPRYQDIPAIRIPVVETGDGIRVKVLAGIFEGTRGPVENIIADPSYFDIAMQSGRELLVPIDPGHTVFTYVYEGEVSFGQTGKDLLHIGQGALFGKGDKVIAKTGRLDARFILIAGKPIGESIAWGGPIVMNTEAELALAYRELREGTFLKH